LDTYVHTVLPSQPRREGHTQAASALLVPNIKPHCLDEQAGPAARVKLHRDGDDVKCKILMSRGCYLPSRRQKQLTNS